MRKKIFTAISIMFIFISCDYSFFDGEIETEGSINPTFAVPLIDANFTMEELLPDDNDLNRHLLIGEDGFMTLVYKENLPSVSIEDFLSNSPVPLPSLSGPFLPEFNYSMDEYTADLDFNLDLNGGNVTLWDPKVKIIITNFWNIPLHFAFDNMKYYVEGDNIGKDVTGSFVTDIHELNSPEIKNDSVITTLEMNVTNSNIDEVLSALPEYISTGAIVGTPGQDTSFDLTGAKDNKIDMEIEIPLNLSMNNILFTDTLDFDLGVNTDSTKVKSLTLSLVANNGFPLGMKTQIYFMDENYNITDSLLNTRLDVVPASVSNGIVDLPIETITTTTVPENRMDNILEAKYLMIHTLLRTTDAENLLPVKIYSNYDIQIKLSAKMETELIL